jgi:hypothetical protein
MQRLICELWAGRVPLIRAFWFYGLGIGILINGIATLVALALAASDSPSWIVLAVHFLPMPWNILVLVAVWRSARAPDVVPEHGALARTLIVLWTTLLIVI